MRHMAAERVSTPRAYIHGTVDQYTVCCVVLIDYKTWRGSGQDGQIGEFGALFWATWQRVRKFFPCRGRTMAKLTSPLGDSTGQSPVKADIDCLWLTGPADRSKSGNVEKREKKGKSTVKTSVVAPTNQNQSLREVRK